MHIHIYATRFPTGKSLGPESRTQNPEFVSSPVQPAVLRDWLVRPAQAITATVESPEAAAAWHLQWIKENPRPDWWWRPDEGPEQIVERARVMLSERGDRVDAIQINGEVIAVTFIPCPTVCGSYGCPQGRSDGAEAWGTVPEPRFAPSNPV
jgi:hypothetical protein